MDDLELNQLIKCRLCHQIYESPVLLPCNQTVCNKHTRSPIINGKYHCHICNQLHSIPVDNFPFDEKTAKLIDLNNRIDFGENNYKAKKECELLNGLVDEGKLLAEDPNCFIHSHFGSLKHKINLKRQEYIATIEENYERVIREINKIELKCKSDAQLKMLELNHILESTKSKLEQWASELRVPNFNKEKQWKSIILKSKQETERIKSLLDTFRNDLLLFKQYKFQAVPVLNNNNFGDFITENVSRIDENRVEAKLQLRIFDFTEFIAKKNETRESIEWCIIKHIPWRLRAVVHETPDFQNALGFGFYPDLELKKLKLNPINTEVKMKVIQKESCGQLKNDLTLQRHFNHRFNKNHASGDPCFVLLKDIMDPANGIYDELNDSITLEATIKVLN